MNKWLVLALVMAVAGGAVGVWLAGVGRGGANADLPAAMVALQRHYAAAGMEIKGGLARAGPREKVRYSTQFELQQSKQVFSVQCFETAEAASAYLRILHQYPATAASLAKGEFVLSLNDWPVDQPMTQRVRAAFESFAAPSL